MVGENEGNRENGGMQKWGKNGEKWEKWSFRKVEVSGGGMRDFESVPDLSHYVLAIYMLKITLRKFGRLLTQFSQNLRVTSILSMLL